MNEECMHINDLIIEYSNNTISKENNNILLDHLAKCEECRKELALILEISQSIRNKTKEVPDYIMKNAFTIISQEEILNPNTSLNDLRSIFVTLKDVLSTTKKTVRLAIQFI